MQTYETLFVTVPTLTEDEEKTVVDGLSQVVSDLGGTMATNDRLGRRRLAYPILKHNDGVYIRFLYDSESAVPKELERRMRLSDKILRALTVKMEPDWATFSKEQAIRDAQARVEAAERAVLEAAEQARLEAEEQARREAEGIAEEGAEGEAKAAPTESDAAGDAAATTATPAETTAEPTAPAASVEATDKPAADAAPAEPSAEAPAEAPADEPKRTEE